MTKTLTPTRIRTGLAEMFWDLSNPFTAPDCQTASRRFIDWFKSVEEKFGNRTQEERGRGYCEEFTLGTPTVSAAKSEIKLVRGLFDLSAGLIEEKVFRSILDDFLFAHTVIWESGVPYSKDGEDEDWTKFVGLYHVTFYNEHHRIDNGVFNKVQMWIATAVWADMDELNTVKINKL